MGLPGVRAGGEVRAGGPGVGAHIGAKKEPRPCFHGRGVYLATTYFHRTYRPTIIGAGAFHFRVRNGTGWFHPALVTRGQCWC